jgi:hypothetical protein
MDTSSRINKDPQDIVLRGFPIGKSIFVPCPWCDRMHLHGWDPADGARVKEWRVAHHACKPAFPQAYQISVFRTEDLERVNYGQLVGGRRYGK